MPLLQLERFEAADWMIREDFTNAAGMFLEWPTTKKLSIITDIVLDARFDRV